MIPTLKALLAIAFIAAGSAKLVDLRGFTSTLLRLLARPETRPRAVTPGVRTLATGVAVGEVVLGVASFTTAWARAIDALVLVACVVFLVIAVYGAVRYPGLQCRCFGSFARSPFGPRTVLRNGVLVLAALIVVALQEEQTVEPTIAEGVVMALVGGLLAAVTGQATRTVQQMAPFRRGSARP